ncbi:MAG TPA: hypothetical protein VFZ59_17800 [Verrucomicrobiae bacterium]|nr:hypothetical protein [Verrucomicrobiae bacterium]
MAHAHLPRPSLRSPADPGEKSRSSLSKCLLVRDVSKSKSGPLKMVCIIWLSIFPPLPRGFSAVQAQFTANAEITSTYFKRDGSILVQTKADGTFTYSNGWWEAVTRSISRDQSTASPFGALQPHTAYCMRIPDGIRHYTVYDGVSNSLTAAVACPINFPPPGDFPLFAIWLSLCPDPELPLLSSNRIRRFVSLPSCEKEVLNHPQNVGDVTARYLDSPERFLASLRISNNGTYVDVKMGGGVDVSTYAEPFDRGFMDFQYEVIETTNIYSLLIPLKTELKRYGIKRLSEAAGGAKLYTGSLVEVAIKNLSLTASPTSRVTPRVLFAFDSRPPQLTAPALVRYSVTNDEWQPVSSTQISRLVKSATVADGNSIEHTNRTASRTLRLIFFLMSFSFLALLIIRSLNPRALSK